MTSEPHHEAAKPPVNVLVVDDHPENLVAMRAILSSPDYRIFDARSGSEALRHLLDQEFAVLLVDVVMPEMSGLELVSVVRQRERTATVPIVLVTAHTEIDLVLKGYEAGAVDYLVRPLVPEVVRAKVSIFADLYRQNERIEEQAVLLVRAERDASELRALELLLASDRRYRNLAEAIPQIVWTADSDGFVDYYNRRWFEYSGLTAEQTVGTWEQVVHPQDQERCAQAWCDAIRTQRVLELECRVRRADGAFRWHLCRAVPDHSPTGRIVSWIGTLTDIEDQKRVQEVLAEFKGTLDAVLDTVVIFDAGEWQLLYANAGACALLGWTTDELLRMHAVDLTAEYDADAFRELIAPLHEGSHDVVSVETMLRRKDGETVPVEIALQLIVADGGRIVAVARDITDRRRAELEREFLYREAVDSIRVRDEFLSIASHELRTPLSAMQLQIQMLQRVHRQQMQAKDAPDPRADTRAEKLEIVARQAERLTTLVGELMDVSKIASGGIALQLEEDVELTALVRDVVARLAEHAVHAQCRVTIRAPLATSGRWDRLRLEQVVTNLLTNAFKFGAGNPVEIVIEHNNESDRLVVRDHGIGLASEDAERIFERYHRTASARAFGGMGLGLYIVRQIVEAHGGTVRVESELGAGSVFTVDLPRDSDATRKGLGRVDFDDSDRPGHR